MNLKTVCVITGGGSGMGLEAAKYLSKDKIIIISGRTESKLQKAIEELKSLGYEAYAFACDISDRMSARKLAEFASSKGIIKNVINCAGLSPSMGSPEQILKINALGTVHVNEEFYKFMENGSVILDVASNSAYVLPKFLINKKIYELASTSEIKFLNKILKRCKLGRTDYEKSGLAYAFSKNFVVWYAQKCAFVFGEKGIRVLSLSPGLVSTDMGNLEAKEGSQMLEYGAEKRMGKPEELGFAIASAVDERNGYLAGVDILCDGGCTNGKRYKK